MRPTQQVEIYPDGIADIYAEADGRKLGRQKASFRFEEQSVGVNRYYSAENSVSSNRIDRVIKVPRTTGIVDRMDIVVLRSANDSRQYRILRIQVKPERGVALWELQSVQVTMQRSETV